MLKVTLIIFLTSLFGCGDSNQDEMIAFEQELNHQTEASIDSAFRIMNARCDSLVEINARRISDSLNSIKKMKKK
ncbi:MAG: hypothetical protein ABIW38_06590 [Ferruginibacter sp.]